MTTRSGPVKVEQSSVKSPSSNSNSTLRRSSSKRLGKSESPLSVPPACASPKKLQPATQILQNKLQDFCTSRTNELVEKSKQSRAAELAQLENRWKNGIPREEGDQIPEEERVQTLPNEEFVSCFIECWIFKIIKLISCIFKATALTSCNIKFN